jgi:phospholipase/lecithinase/hemolysin
MRAGYPGLNLYYVDFGKLSNDVTANPSAFGFTNTSAPCYPFFSFPSAPVCANSNQYVFWDELHPGPAMHALAAQLAITALGQ